MAKTVKLIDINPYWSVQVDRIWWSIIAKTEKLRDIKRNWSVQVDMIWWNIRAKTVKLLDITRIWSVQVDRICWWNIMAMTVKLLVRKCNCMVCAGRQDLAEHHGQNSKIVCYKT